MNGQIETVYLEFREGTSDKFYRITAVGDSSGWITTVIWGRRGSNGQTQLKYEGPSEAAAKACLSDLYHQKRAKGYQDALDPLGPVAPSAPAYISPPSPGFTAAVAAASLAVPRFPAMKAREVPIDWSALDGYVMEEKFDGHRAGITFESGGSINVRNVYGEDKGRIANMPHIQSALLSLAGSYYKATGGDLYAGTLIDGEMVGLTLAETTHLLGGGGVNDPRLRFVAFDLPFLAGEDLRDEPFLARRAELEKLWALIPPGPLHKAQLYDCRKDVVEEIWDRGGEGVVIKPHLSSYVPGGRYDWIKVKEHHTAEAVVTSWVTGNGKYSTEIGALVLSQWKNGRFQEVTKVSGMTDAVRKDMKVNWDTVWQDRVIEFEYQSKTPTGSYRHPRFVRPRDDKKGSDCTWETSP